MMKSPEIIVDFEKEYHRIVEEHKNLKTKYNEVRKENLILRKKYYDCKMKLAQKVGFGGIRRVNEKKEEEKKRDPFEDEDVEEESWEVWKFPFLSLIDEIKIQILSFLNSESEIPKHFCLNEEMYEFMNLRSTLRGIVISKLPYDHRSQLNEELMTSIELYDLLFKPVVLEVDINELDLYVEEGKKRVEPPDQLEARVIETYDPEFISDEEMICFVNEELIIEEYDGFNTFIKGRKKKEKDASGYVPLRVLEMDPKVRYTYQMSLSLFPMNRLDYVTFDYTDWPKLEDKVATEADLLKDMKFQLEEELWYIVNVMFKVRVKPKKKPVLKAYGRLL